MDELRDGKARACLDASAAARARGDLAGAISELNSAVFLRPTDASLYAARAELLLDACDFATALANLAKAVALTERRDLALILRLAHALDARGLTLLDEADYTGAVNAFGEALAALVKATLDFVLSQRACRLELVPQLGERHLDLPLALVLEDLGGRRTLRERRGARRAPLLGVVACGAAIGYVRQVLLHVPARPRAAHALQPDAVVHGGVGGAEALTRWAVSVLRRRVPSPGFPERLHGGGAP